MHVQAWKWPIILSIVYVKRLKLTRKDEKLTYLQKITVTIVKNTGGTGDTCHYWCVDKRKINFLNWTEEIWFLNQKWKNQYVGGGHI